MWHLWWCFVWSCNSNYKSKITQLQCQHTSEVQQDCFSRNTGFGRFMFPKKASPKLPAFIFGPALQLMLLKHTFRKGTPTCFPCSPSFPRLRSCETHGRPKRHQRKGSSPSLRRELQGRTVKLQGFFYSNSPLNDSKKRAESCTKRGILTLPVVLIPECKQPWW